MLNEINVLCIGQIIQEKTTFLQHHTDALPKDNNQQYEIFLRKQRIQGDSVYVYLHEVKQREGMQIFVKYSFDAILFFVKIDVYHNTVKNILQSLRIYSQVNGCNVYEVPICVIVIPKTYGLQYGDISEHNKRTLYEELSIILNQDQIIYVQFDRKYQYQLIQIYKQIINGKPAPIKESIYSNFTFQGVSYFSLDQIKLATKKVYEQFRRYILNKYKRFKFKQNKHQ